jgi:two-component sensor histidine kinase
MREPRGPLAISAAYLLFGLLWIVLSDRFVAGIAPSPELLTSFQTYKGWFFVVISSLLLFGALRVYAARKRRALSAAMTAEAQARRSVQDKEQLISELHHRVKNNLQVLISMLRLDERVDRAGAEGYATAGVAGSAAARDGDAADHNAASAATADLRRRVMLRLYAIALVHDNIYRSDFASEVDMERYIEDHLQQLAALRDDVADPENRIRVERQVSGDLVPMHIDQAVPCGIFLNEAVTNAFQHAYAADAGGHIRVTLSAARNPEGGGRNPEGEGRRWRLLVEDYGRGFHREEFSGTLGLTLMRGMAQQLNGELILDSGATGTRVGVDFTT